ncbi:MAG: hypothetical protein HOP19_00700, partial [Acidobacteria bacterium]|nr:hypothetical protein [Acidobacteriota bacterium]
MSCLLLRISVPAILLMCGCLFTIPLFAQTAKPDARTASISGRITIAALAEELLRYDETIATNDGAFQFDHIAPGKDLSKNNLFVSDGLTRGVTRITNPR